MKKIIISFLFFLSCLSCFARQNLDDVIIAISKDIALQSKSSEIIVVMDFTSDTLEMSSYIKSQLISALSQNADIKISAYANTGNDDLETFVESGINEVITGSLDELDNKYILQVKMLNVAQGAYTLFKSYAVSRSSKTEQLLHHSSKVYKSSLGNIIEINKNSISYFAPAVGISFDYSINRCISLGIKALVSYDVLYEENTIMAIEPLCFLRWYVVSPTGEPSAGLFAECQCAPEILFVNSNVKTSADVGVSLGFRIAFYNFYIEPFLRGGYPYLFGAGINTGFRF